jgi:hypothetical protein
MDRNGLRPRALILALLVACSIAPAAQAACTELLRVETGEWEAKPRLSLTDCDVTARFEGNGRNPRVLLRLQARAADVWRSALAPGGDLFAALLGAELAVKSHAGSIPAALLLSTYSARGVAAHAWLWEASSATLRIAPVDSTAGIGGNRCPKETHGGPMLWLQDLEVPPGALIAPSAFWTTRPGSYDRIAPSCLAGWFLSEGAPAVVHPALGLTIVAPSAPDGTVFDLRAHLSGQPDGATVEGRVRITDPALHPLAGRWTETKEKLCDGAWRPPAQPIGELVFKADGTFTLVKVPFESYYDYWGTYRYTPQTGALALEITGGNKVPSAQMAKGIAHIGPSGELRLEGLPPADAVSSQPICAHQFQRD